MRPGAAGPVAGDGARWTVAARIAYLLVVALATLTRLEADADPGRVLERLAGALSPSVSPRDAVDGIRNLILFAGWGATWIATSPAGRAVLQIGAATATGAVLSLVVEAAQLLSPVRTASILDLLTNTGGAFGGAVGIALLVALIRSRRERRSFVGVPAFLFGGAYLAAVVLETLIPLFRQAPVPGADGGPVERFAASVAMLRADGGLELPFLDFPLFLPAGALLVAALVELGAGYRVAALMAAIGGAAAVGGVEVVRGFAGQPIEPGAFVVHAAGIGLGAWAAARWLPGLTSRLRGRARPRSLLSAYAVVLGLWSLRPYLPKLDLAPILRQFSSGHFIPLEALGGRVDLFSATDVCIQFLLYLPLGGLLAVWPLRATGPLGGLRPAFLLAAVLEASQILVVDRFFDVTDLLVQCAGAAVGWVIVRRSGFRPYGTVLDAGLPPASVRAGGRAQPEPE